MTTPKTYNYSREIRGMLAIWLAGALLALAFFSPAPALAAVAPAPTSSTNPCGVEGWYVNPDEGHRVPTRTLGGFVFEDTDLIHHAVQGLSTKDLTNGAYAATPLPDQPSFFSVEVAGTDGGYATLRWNPTTLLWSAVVGGTLYENADPDKLVDMPPVKRSHTVVSFGVGYTNSPPGTVKTTVKSVSFMGKVYSFTCLAPTATSSPTSSPSVSSSPTSSGSPTATPTSSSPSASASPSMSSQTPTASPSTTSSTTTVPLPGDNASDDGGLPTTGTSLTGIVLLGLGVLLAGGLITWWFRRNRTSDDSYPTD